MEKGNKQTTDTILMIEPVSFGYNAQTATNNYFQQNDDLSSADVQKLALEEFNQMVEKLRSKGLNIIVVSDTPLPHTPDSIFPNNWLSSHQDGRLVLYPMYAENRRAERRSDILRMLAEKGFKVLDIVNYSPFEKRRRFLEGTGSMIFDRENSIAYAALSERTDKELFFHFCEELNFKPVCFSANQLVGNQRLPIYHTNVMMCVANKYSVICLDTIDDKDERKIVVDSLENSGKEIIAISEKQMHRFAGNMLQVENKDGLRYLVMSLAAFESLSAGQIDRLTSFNEIIPIAIPTIERYGGGSVRCMMAEIFNPVIKKD
jgi:hypothetical protein